VIRDGPAPNSQLQFEDLFMFATLLRVPDGEINLLRPTRQLVRRNEAFQFPSQFAQAHATIEIGPSVLSQPHGRLLEFMLNEIWQRAPQICRFIGDVAFRPAQDHHSPPLRASRKDGFLFVS